MVHLWAPVTECGEQRMLTRLPFCTVEVLEGENIVQVIACGLNLLHKQASIFMFCGLLKIKSN